MDLNKKLKELKPQQLNCNVFDVYSYNGLTMQDLLCQFFTTINECVKSTNEVIDLTDWLVNIGLEEEVVKKLMVLIEDGTVEKLINVNLFNTLNDKINEQLNTKASKDEINIERKRIDLLTKVESGQTEGNTELLDIRIGSNGKEYETAGKSVREQFSQIHQDLSVLKNVKNLYNPNDKVINNYYFEPNELIFAEGWKAVKIKVEGNKDYTMFGHNIGLSWFGDSSTHTKLGIIDKNYFKTPVGTEYLYVSIAPDTSDIVLLETPYHDIISYSQAPYGKIIETYYNNEIKNINSYKINNLYVSNNGSDTTGDGSKTRPFATIYKANSVITDNSEKNRYVINVANGHYNEFESKYSGVDSTNGLMQGIVVKDYVSYIGNEKNPAKVILEWDGIKGFEGTVNYNNVLSAKCIFHLTNNTMKSNISGFTLQSKNTRYALHCESVGGGESCDFTVKNLIINWYGCPDSDNPHPPAIGTGSSPFEIGRFEDITINFIDFTGEKIGFQNHDNNYFVKENKPSIIKGSEYYLKNINFNNSSIQFRTIHAKDESVADTYHLAYIENCVGLTSVTNTVIGNVQEPQTRIKTFALNIDARNENNFIY